MNGVEVIVPILVIIFVIWLIFELFAIVGEMAERRGHNPWPWWLLSLAWSPFSVMFIMWVFFPVEDSKSNNN